MYSHWRVEPTSRHVPASRDGWYESQSTLGHLRRQAQPWRRAPPRAGDPAHDLRVRSVQAQPAVGSTAKTPTRPPTRRSSCAPAIGRAKRKQGAEASSSGQRSIHGEADNSRLRTQAHREPGQSPVRARANLR
jgi:hypothetical protein